jgi:hypothetical protein
MTTFDPAEVRKAVAEFTPRRPQKFQVLNKPWFAVTNARIVPLRFTSRALVTSLHFQDSNQPGGLPSALVGGHCAPLADHRPKPDNSHEKCICIGWIPARSPRRVYGSPAPVKVVRNTSLALRAGGSVCGSTVDSARRANDMAG